MEQNHDYLDKSASTHRKKRATWISVCTAIFLLLLKIVIFTFTASLAILASAIDSFLDLLISLSNYFVVRKSEHAPTENFRFGFGRLEEIAGLFQGIVISGTGISIMVAIFMGDVLGRQVNSPSYILGVMAFSMLITWVLTRFLQQEALATRSSVLEADSAHYRADLYSNAGIFFGALLLIYTGWDLIDGILCLILAMLILKDGMQISFKALQVLLDREAEPEVSTHITDTLQSFIDSDKIAGYHAVRTRKTGSKYFAEVHLVFNGEILLKDAHAIAHQLEAAVQQRLPRLEITLHLDPYNDEAEDRFRTNV